MTIDEFKSLTKEKQEHLQKKYSRAKKKFFKGRLAFSGQEVADHKEQWLKEQQI